MNNWQFQIYRSLPDVGTRQVFFHLVTISDINNTVTIAAHIDANVTARELEKAKVRVKCTHVNGKLQLKQPVFFNADCELLDPPWKPSSHSFLHNQFYDGDISALAYVSVLYYLRTAEPALMEAEEYTRSLHEIYRRGKLTDTEYLVLREPERYLAESQVMLAIKSFPS